MEIVGGDETESPSNLIRVYNKWKEKADRILFVLEATGEKVYRPTLKMRIHQESHGISSSSCFQRRTQVVCNCLRELMNISQGDMTVSENFLKVKNLWREIE